LIDAPLIILGGGREAARPGFEIGVDDDGRVNPAVGKVLRRFLSEVFPGIFVEREPEMEWVCDFFAGLFGALVLLMGNFFLS
jgi:hypothetical protein